MPISVSIVVGNPKPQSRTRQVAEALVAQLVGVENHAEVIDLADYADKLFGWGNPEMDAINERVAHSDLVVFASPTYKATYTGLLKAFLDRYQTDGLAGVTAIPLLTGASMGHSMGPTVNLAPLLMELGAVVPGRGCYFVMDDMERLDEVAATAADEYRRNLKQVLRVAQGM